MREHLNTLPQDIHEVYLSPTLKGSLRDQLDLHAHRAEIPVRYESPEFFRALAPGGGHQGVAARLDPFSYASLQQILEKETHTLLVLDGILDPRNLGALLRTAEAVGVGGVILPERRTAPLSAVVEKTAAGATAYLPVCHVKNLVRALDRIQAAGYWLVGLAPEAPQSIYELQVGQKVAVLLGGEEKGLRPLVRDRCDCLIALPMRGHIGSLNVSVAGAIALYEFLRRSLCMNEKHEKLKK